MCAPSADWGGAHNFGLYIGASPKEKGTNFGGNNWGTNRAIKESKIPCPSCRDDGLLNMQISHKIKTNVRCWYACVCNAWIFFSFIAVLPTLCHWYSTWFTRVYYENCSNFSPELATLSFFPNSSLSLLPWKFLEHGIRCLPFRIERQYHVCSFCRTWTCICSRKDVYQQHRRSKQWQGKTRM